MIVPPITGQTIRARLIVMARERAGDSSPALCGPAIRLSVVVSWEWTFHVSCQDSPFTTIGAARVVGCHCSALHESRVFVRVLPPPFRMETGQKESDVVQERGHWLSNPVREGIDGHSTPPRAYREVLPSLCNSVVRPGALSRNCDRRTNTACRTVHTSVGRGRCCDLQCEQTTSAESVRSYG